MSDKETIGKIEPLEVASITIYDDNKLFELLDRIATALEKISKGIKIYSDRP